MPGRRLEPDLLPAIVDEGVAQGIEAQLSTQRQRGHDFRAADEGQRRGHAVVAPGKVTVEGCDNSVLFLALDVLTFPLPDARPAGIGQNHPADFRERLDGLGHWQPKVGACARRLQTILNNLLERTQKKGPNNASLAYAMQQKACPDTAGTPLECTLRLEIRHLLPTRALPSGGRLMIHELFHRIQSDLHLPAKDPTNRHLDTLL